MVELNTRREDPACRAIMVSETHWDRAWYVPFESFRVRLARLIDRVIDVLDSDPEFKSFMLDGQMLPVEDYLQIRPERRADLERLVRSGRLRVGPWYALADEYLVSPEALIRNLIIGMHMAEDLGDVMREGYVPDAFGHVNQLPQILQGFGIRSAVFWRGVGDEGERLTDQFWWEAPDGSRVLAVHLSDGYHNASNLGYPMRWGDTSAMEPNMDLAMEQLRRAVAWLQPRAPTRNLLLMNGIDHAEADPRAPQVIAAANREFTDVQIEHGTLSQFVQSVLDECGGGEPPLATFEGEFNRGRYAVILQGVYSTRIYIKQANERVQTLLERYAEPLAAWAWTVGACSGASVHPTSCAPYPAAFLDHAWRRLLQNHPHDDICGCSVDAVHRENMVRFNDAEQVASIVARDSFRSLVSHIDRTAQPGVPFVLYNPLAWPLTGTVEVSLLFDRVDPRAGRFSLVDAAGRPASLQVLERGKHFDMEVLKANRKQEVRAAVRIEDLPACGYRVYYAVPVEDSAQLPTVPSPVALLSNGMENSHLRVEINPDGSLEVLDRATGCHFSRLGYFEDAEDAGDEYDYSPSRESETITSLNGQARLRLVHSGHLQVTWEIALKLLLPVSLTANRQRRRRTRINCPVTVQVTLRHDSRAVEVRAAIDNRARDHRLRVCFPTGLAADESAAGGHFDVVTRPVELPKGEGWAQSPAPTRHQRGFVDLSDGRTGLAVFSRGLPEYEVVGSSSGQKTIAVTLLRCVDAISRGDMLSRPSHAGTPSLAPDAQCQGRLEFEYAIHPHAGDWASVYRDAVMYQAPLYLRRGDETEGYLPDEVWEESSPDVLQGPVTLKAPQLGGDLPGELSFLSLTPDTLVLSAIKLSEPRGGAQGEHALIVRFYNPTPQSTDAMLRTFRPIRSAALVNLNEEFMADLPLTTGNALALPVGPKQVRTVAIQF